MKPTLEQLKNAAWWAQNAPPDAKAATVGGSVLPGWLRREQPTSGPYWWTPFAKSGAFRQGMWYRTRETFIRCPYFERPAVSRWSGEGLPPAGCLVTTPPDSTPLVVLSVVWAGMLMVERPDCSFVLVQSAELCHPY